MSYLGRLTVISRRTMYSLTKKPLLQPPYNPAPTIPPQELVDEEVCPNYNPAAFYPAFPRRGARSKLPSTVWLAPDISRNKWQSEQTVALKITNNDDTDEAQHERTIERHLADQDSFEVSGQKGKHICLERFVNRTHPLPIAKAYIYILLNGLDYLHSICKVVHTDLKLDNILMSFENDHLLSDFVEKRQAMEYKTAAGRTIYRCHNDFGPIKAEEVRNFVPKISDFGLATQLDNPSPQDGVTKKQIGVYPIQPDHYRAPEVLLGCGWDFKADIWNFGVLMWDLIGSTELFSQTQDASGRYDSRSHMAEMISLLGPPPKVLLERSNSRSQQDWPRPITNEAGKLCNNAREFFGGPFFDEDGQFSYSSLVPKRNLEETVSCLQDKDRGIFLSFARDMLAWLPEERKTARELMDHPFLKLGG
ncbi:protein kinase [Aspergillus venezuelensis]